MCVGEQSFGDLHVLAGVGRLVFDENAFSRHAHRDGDPGELIGFGLMPQPAPGACRPVRGGVRAESVRQCGDGRGAEEAVSDFPLTLPRASALSRRRRRRHSKRFLHVLDIGARVGDDVLRGRARFKDVPTAATDVVELLRHPRPVQPSNRRGQQHVGVH